ncbi:DEAD/DEAH box helicase, partial [Rivihabitans pingtungensis]
MSQSAFEALGLDARIVSTLTQNQLTTPTPVQEQTIPLLLQGRDLIGSAQTGTGKTAAFLLPALHRLAQTPGEKGRGARVLVLTPTRELAQQVARAAETFSKGLQRMKTVCVVGGVSYRIQNDLLAKPHEILVATPGRLIDHVNARRIDFSRLEMLVLDEADRMLDMGFSDDVLAIANQLPKERQTAFFTATMTHNVRTFASQLLNDPATVEVAPQTARHEQIDQMLCYVDDLGHKKRLLKHFLAQEGIKQAIIFTATKRDTEELADELCVEGLRAAALHGDMPQRERTRTLTQLRRGEFDLLVATDVAARGIDVAGISHVFNFDLPRFAEDYVHRIGRTGRAGATGTAIALVGRDDVMPLRRIERFTSHKIRVHEVEGMESRFRPQDRKPGAGGGRPHGGKRPNGGGGWGGKKS